MIFMYNKTISLLQIEIYYQFLKYFIRYNKSRTELKINLTIFVNLIKLCVIEYNHLSQF